MGVGEGGCGLSVGGGGRSSPEGVTEPPIRGGADADAAGIDAAADAHADGGDEQGANASECTAWCLLEKEEARGDVGGDGGKGSESDGIAAEEWDDPKNTVGTDGMIVGAFSAETVAEGGEAACSGSARVREVASDGSGRVAAGESGAGREGGVGRAGKTRPAADVADEGAGEGELGGNTVDARRSEGAFATCASW
jgi:hypothetical protein